MKIILDGKEVTAEAGRTILEVARQNGVDIPTLCHVPALEPAAMCRLHGGADRKPPQPHGDGL